jgi:hypothetical protein
MTNFTPKDATMLGAEYEFIITLLLARMSILAPAFLHSHSLKQHRKDIGCVNFEPFLFFFVVLNIPSNHASNEQINHYRHLPH